MSYGFIQEHNSTLILKSRSKSVSNYLPKGVVIIEQASHDMKNVPLIFQNHIHAINMNDSNSIMSCSTPIYSVANTLRKIYLRRPLWDEFTYECYTGINDYFGLLFQQYTSKTQHEISFWPNILTYLSLSSPWFKSVLLYAWGYY